MEVWNELRLNNDKSDSMLVLLVDFVAFVCITTHLIYQSEMFLNLNRFFD